MTFGLIRLIELCRGCSHEKANSFHEDVPLISLMRIHNYSGMPLRPGDMQWFKKVEDGASFLSSQLSKTNIVNTIGKSQSVIVFMRSGPRFD